MIAERAGESDLIAGLVRRDESALRSLIDEVGGSVYSKALQIVRDPRLAEEIAQDTMLVLWWDPTRFDASKGGLRSFLVGVARFKSIDRVRREAVVRSKESRSAEAEGFFANEPAADRGVDVAMAVRSAIRTLPEIKREVIFLAFFKGMTYREVAQVLGLPEGTVKTRLRDSLIKLRSVLAVSGI